MSTVAEKTAYTIEELLAMPDRKNYELVDGQLVKVNVSNLSALVATKTCTRLENHCSSCDLGAVFDAGGYLRLKVNGTPDKATYEKILQTTQNLRAEAAGLR